MHRTLEFRRAAPSHSALGDLNDRSARVARRYGNDMGAARAAAQKAVEEAAFVDAATRNALAALV